VIKREYEMWQEMVRSVLDVVVNTKMHIRYNVISRTLK